MAQSETRARANTLFAGIENNAGEISLMRRCSLPGAAKAYENLVLQTHVPENGAPAYLHYTNISQSITV